MSFFKNLVRPFNVIRQIGQKVSGGIRQIGQKVATTGKLYNEIKGIPIVGSLIKGVEKSPIGQTIKSGMSTAKNIYGDAQRISGYISAPEQKLIEAQKKVDRMKRLSRSILK